MPYCIVDILIQSDRKLLRPFITYQVGMIPAQQRHDWLTILIKQIFIDSAYPLDVVQVYVLPITVCELKKGELFIWLAPMQ